MAIQNAINSMIGSASRAVVAVKAYQNLKTRKAIAAEKGKARQAQAAQKVSQSPQQMAAEKARQSAANAIKARADQRRSFMDYLKNQPTSLGKVGDLPDHIQKQIAKQITPNERQRMMKQMEEEAKRGKHQ